MQVAQGIGLALCSVGIAEGDVLQAQFFTQGAFLRHSRISARQGLGVGAAAFMLDVPLLKRSLLAASRGFSQNCRTFYEEYALTLPWRE
ncbi:hypothetical protein SAMN05192586_1316 [Desulfovibrio legallii]|uniref:Uncharacterized protein n=1 Tax=Desulfovibrio legallii TaxID=571438 RepID=A0A1G7R7J6_9BACT|nr:hypothetical protein SAMN05192586_1316 [Desulfovibrio legallii]